MSHLAAPAGPHVVVPPQRLAVPHEAEVHGRPDELAVKGQVHAAHGEERALHG